MSLADRIFRLTPKIMPPFTGKRRNGICPISEWRSDIDTERVGVGAPRSDHRTWSTLQAACRYPFRYMVTGGGLICIGPDVVDQCRSAAGYINRVLKGAKPADLPVQAPT
jgi:hypothetical protein